MKKLTFRHWLSLILIGLTGQFAWTIENMYFNVYLFNTISQNYSYISAMVAASAVVATLTTLLIGVLSDRLGKRKAIVVSGYILWGIVTGSFGFITVDNIKTMFPLVNAEMMAAIIVVIMDCVMTFFGSSANDAAFNAYITDITDDGNRGKVEGVLAILPLVSMLVIIGGFSWMTDKGMWLPFYLIFGGLTIVVGIVALFVMPKDVVEPNKEANYLANLIYGFKPNVIKNNLKLYVGFIGFFIYQMAVQVFFPYLMIYLQRYLNLENYAILLGIVLILASIFSVVFGLFVDRIGKLKVLAPAIAFMALGLLLMYFIRPGDNASWMLIVFGTLMMIGYMVVASVYNALIRDYTPKDKVGLFQGIRMIFQVALPMCTGPFIGSAIISTSSTYVDEFNRVVHYPNPEMFLGAAGVLILSVIPALILVKMNKKKEETNEVC